MIPWDADDLALDASRFRGVVRLFPLPDLVLFPHVMQPLHVFEPRYLRMLSEALDSDGLIGVGTLAPGWEANYEGRPPLCDTLCIGRVITHVRLEDGAYNVMLLGLCRARLTAELPPAKEFREARVELLEDVYTAAAAETRNQLQADLCAAFQRFLPKEFADNASLAELFSSEASLAALTDLVSFAAPLDAPVKYELLAERDVDARARRLCSALSRPLEGGAKPARDATRRPPFPPPFSRN